MCALNLALNFQSMRTIYSNSRASVLCMYTLSHAWKCWCENLLTPYCWVIVRKYSFHHGHETDIAVNMDNFWVNAAYISVAVNSKNFTIRSRYGDSFLFLHYSWGSGFNIVVVNSNCEYRILLFVVKWSHGLMVTWDKMES